MSFRFKDRNRIQIKSIPSHGLECPDTALTKQDIKVPFTQDILCAHQKIFNRSRHSALQHHRKLGSADLTEEREVLHIARSNLEAISVFTDQLQIFGIHHLRDNGQTRFATRFGQQLKTGLAQTLETV